MAIAFDSISALNATVATSLTFAFNNVAGDAVYVMGHDRASGASQVTGVTYNGVAMTKVVELNGVGGGVANDRAITLWRLIGPATGSNNVVVTSSVSNNLRFTALSYSGVDQTTPENGTDTSTGDSVTTISTDITTSTDGCWMLSFSKDSTGGVTYSNSTGDTIRLNADAGGHCITDTNSSFAAGSNTITNTMSSVDLGIISVAVRPAAAVTNSNFFAFM